MIRPGFKTLEKSEAKWFSMQEEARKQHLRKVALTQVWELNMDEIEVLPSQQEPARASKSQQHQDRLLVPIQYLGVLERVFAVDYLIKKRMKTNLSS